MFVKEANKFYYCGVATLETHMNVHLIAAIAFLSFVGLAVATAYLSAKYADNKKHSANKDE